VEFTEPKKNLEHLHFNGNAVVLDFGAGSGHYAIFVAERMMGHKGKVIAIDIQRSLLAKIKNEADRLGLGNLEIVWGDAEEIRGTALPDMIGDAAIVSNILFQIVEKDIFVQEIARTLKHGAEVLFVDWTDSFGGMGPELGAIVKEEDARKLFERHGFKVAERFDAGAHHYGLVFKRTVSDWHSV